MWRTRQADEVHVRGTGFPGGGGAQAAEVRADLVVISEHVEEGELVRVQRAAVLLDEERGIA